MRLESKKPMLQPDDLRTIQSLLEAYRAGRCTLEEFVAAARAVIAHYNPHLSDQQVGKRVRQILSRIPA